MHAQLSPVSVTQANARPELYAYRPAPFSSRRKAAEEHAGDFLCQWCRLPVDVDAQVCDGGQRFCGPQCHCFARESGLRLLPSKDASTVAISLRPPPGADEAERGFEIRVARRLPYALLRADLQGETMAPEFRKLEAVFERIGMDGLRDDTLVLWCAVGPFVFYWRDEVELRTREERVNWERGAFAVLMRYAFFARKELRTTADVPMHVELARPLRVGGGVALARSAFRLLARETLRVDVGNVARRDVDVHGGDYTQFLHMTETPGAGISLTAPLRTVSVTDQEAAAAAVLRPASLGVQALTAASTT